MSATFATRDDGPAVELDIAGDLLRRALPVAPVLVLLGGLGWGWAGALSAAFAVLLVLLNFLLSAALIAWTARISLGLMMGVVLGGFLVRLALIFLAVWAVSGTWWFEPWPLSLTLIVTHLGLLVWETRHVSASLAFPGLKPPPHPSPEPEAKEHLQ